MNNIGIPDDRFIREKVPMTKSEVRALTILKLKLTNNDFVWDIGAGTGSISIEASLNVSDGKVFAIEKNPDALKLIKRNKEKFKCNNLEIIEGSAPDAFRKLPSPTKAIIGGSGGNLQEIINYLWFKTDVDIIVVNAVTLNTAFNAIKIFSDLNAKIDAAQISVAKIKLIKDYQMFQAHNPVFIISAEKQEEKI